MKPSPEAPDNASTRSLLKALEQAGHALLETSLEKRLRALDEVRALWLEDDGLRTALVPLLAAASQLAPAMLDLHLRRTFSAWSGTALRRLLNEAKVQHPSALQPRRVAIVLAANTPALAVAPLFSALALGATVVLKPARGETAFSNALVASLARVEPRLGAAATVLPWKGGIGDTEDLVLSSVDRIVAYGTATTLAALQARFGCRVVAHGPRASAVVVADLSRPLQEIARDIALDAALLDQRGCLSPQWVLVRAPLAAEDLSRALACELAGLEAAWPRRALDLEEALLWRGAVDQAEAEFLAGRIKALHGGGTRPWAVTLESTPELRPTLPGRFLRVIPVPDDSAIETCLAPLRGHLECIGLEASASDQRRLRRIAFSLGAHRVCALGSMQDPPAAWHASGHHPIQSLLMRGSEDFSEVGASASLPAAALMPAALTTAHQALDLQVAALADQVLPPSASQQDDEQWRARFRRHIAQTSAEPRGLVVERASGSRIFSRDGRGWLDLLAGLGVASIGHAHPRVADAVAAQARRYTHVMVYGEDVLEPQVKLAERLAAKLPPHLDSIYFTNSGAEAIEGALKLTRKHSGRSRVLAFQGSFHGDTTGALALGGNPFYREPFRPLLEGVEHLPWNDAAAFSRIDESVAAVFVEPIQAEGGVRLPAADFLPRLAARCRATGTLLVLDEVVTAFGRTGRWFAFEHWPGAEPDVLVLAKALGGGLPLGAFVASRKRMQALSEDPPLGHVTTFGGNPVCCAAALASLDVMEEEDLPARSARLGEQMLARLRILIGRGGLIEVRGLGLLLGMEFAEPDDARRFVDGCRLRGVLVGWTLHQDRVVRLAPPLVLSAEEMDEALSVFEQALGTMPD